MDYIEVKITDIDGMKEMSDLASKIVKEHYDPILGEKQNNYMIDKFQSPNAIKEQLEQGYKYYFVSEEKGEKIGFIAYYLRKNDLYISKFYLHKDYRNKGISKDMLEFLTEKTKESRMKYLILNVNKYNEIAITAYEKLGFIRVGKEKNDIGNGYFMDDYVYSKEVIYDTRY